MVQAKVICDRFGIPRGSIYRLVRENLIPYHIEPPKPWQTKRKRNIVFKPSEVEAALKRLKEERPGYSA